MFENLMKKFVKFIDPKFEKYRTKKAPSNIPKFTPKSLEDFIDVMRRTPKDILSTNDRSRIAAVMSFDSRKVADLMAAKDKMIFVHEKDFLGPLMLDKLYRSGFTDFPVVDSKEKVKGVIHTDALNALEIKKTDRAEKYLDKNFQYLHTDDSLEFATSEIERTNSCYFLVLNKDDSLAGFLTLQMIFDYLLGQS